MIKAKYKIPNTNIEIDAIYIQKSYVLKDNHRIVVNFDVHDASIGITDKPVAFVEHRLNVGTQEYDNAYAQIMPVLDDMSDTSLMSESGFEDAVKESRLIVPTYIEPEPEPEI